MCLAPHLQAVQMLINIITLQRQGNANPGPSVFLSMEMKQHSSVSPAEGLSMQASRKSHFCGRVVSQERNSFPSRRMSQRDRELGAAL